MIHSLTYVRDLPNGYRRYRCNTCCQTVRIAPGREATWDGCPGLGYVPAAPVLSPQSPIPNPQSLPSPDGSAWLANGGPVATRMEFERRLAICNRCDRLETCAPTICEKRKLWETGVCQFGKWDARQRNIPATGLISPADQWCIQIEATNHCPRSCSNCTRHCPHVRKPFFMSPETFREAVLSMDGFPGMLGIQGGEPTLHPKFEKLVGIYHRLWTPEKGPALTGGRQPVADFGAYHADHLANANRRRGLWSGLGPGYYRHFELIQSTFAYQCLNDHANAARHAPLLVTRKELGIPDAEWLRYRDSCWIQREWSSSITPKGCFPCEIMASLDMLYDGPGGWPIEPGWWKRGPADFGAMLDWCELCGACLPLETREAREEIQDVSLCHVEKLWPIGSPALAAGKFKIFDVANWKPAPAKRDADWYMPSADKRRRVSPANRSIKPRSLEGFLVSVDCGDQLERVLARNVPHFDRLVVVTGSHDTKTQQVAWDAGAALVVSDDCYRDGVAFNKGLMLNHGLAALELSDWVLNLDADILLPADFRDRLFDLVLNPGCLYYARRRQMLSDDTLGHADIEANDFAPWGYFQLWHPAARALRDLAPLRYPAYFCSAGNVDTWWQHRWPWEKKIRLTEGAEFDLGHVPHGPLTGRWNGQGVRDGWRYVGQSNIGRGLPATNGNGDGFLRIVRVDDCFRGIIPVEAAGKKKPKVSGIYEYQFKPALTEDERFALTTWRDYFQLAGES